MSIRDEAKDVELSALELGYFSRFSWVLGRTYQRVLWERHDEVVHPVGAVIVRSDGLWWEKLTGEIVYKTYRLVLKGVAQRWDIAIDGLDAQMVVNFGWAFRAFFIGTASISIEGKVIGSVRVDRRDRDGYRFGTLVWGGRKLEILGDSDRSSNDGKRYSSTLEYPYEADVLRFISRKFPSIALFYSPQKCRVFSDQPEVVQASAANEEYTALFMLFILFLPIVIFQTQGGD